MKVQELFENGNLGLTIFDIDDTLFRTTAQIKVVKDGKIIKSLNNQEFNTYKLQPGESFDFGEFQNAEKFNRESIPIEPMIAKLKAIINNAGNSKVIMLTARSDFDNKELFLDTFRKYGIDMSRVHVHRAGNLGGSPSQNKAVWIRKYLDTGKFARVRLYDDAMSNIKMFINLQKEYPDVKFFPYFVTHEGSIKTIREEVNINNKSGGVSNNSSIIDNKNGWGAVPNNQEVDYLGLRVTMTPKHFIELAAPLDGEPSEKIAQHLEQGGTIGSPFLRIEIPESWENGDFSMPARVVGHEGRNRMAAIGKVFGNNPVETHLFFSQGLRNRHITDEFKKNLNRGLVKEKSKSIIRGPFFSLTESIREDGRIVKGVNTTVDVGPNEIKTQAAKFGNTVDRDGRPPTMSKAVKGKSTNVLYNLGLVESYKLQLERDKQMLVLNITNAETGRRTEVRGKLGYESGNYDPNDDLHQLLDALGKSASISDLMNGDVVTINPRHPDGDRAKAATDRAYREERYTAREWAIMEGGHSLEESKPKGPGDIFNALNEYEIEDRHPNERPVGPETKPTMPKGTIRVKVSDVYDWYKLGQHISDLEGLGKHDFGKGPPEAVISFGSEEQEHKYIKLLKKLGLDIIDVDPGEHGDIKGIEKDSNYNVGETRSFQPQTTPLQALVLEYLTFTSTGIMTIVSDGAKSPQAAEELKKVFQTLNQSNKKLQAVANDKQKLEANKTAILKNIYDMMTYAIAHLKANMIPQEFDSKKKQINSVLTKYNDLTKNESVEENFAESSALFTFKIKRRKLNVPALIKAGAIFITYPHGEQGWETNDKQVWSYSLISLYNVQSGGWPKDAKNYLKPQSYKRAEQQINSSAPNLGSDQLVYDGKYNQILWSIKKLGIPDNVAFLDNSQQDVAENFADGKNPGRKGLAKRSGVNTKASVSSLRKTAKNSSGEKQRMAHWLANMKAGRKKAAKK